MSNALSNERPTRSLTARKCTMAIFTCLILGRFAFDAYDGLPNPSDNSVGTVTKAARQSRLGQSTPTERHSGIYARDNTQEPRSGSNDKDVKTPPRSRMRSIPGFTSSGRGNGLDLGFGQPMLTNQATFRPSGLQRAEQAAYEAQRNFAQQTAAQMGAMGGLPLTVHPPYPR
jgi:hypothetical protein